MESADTSALPTELLRSAARGFAFGVRAENFQRWGRGRIHASFRVDTGAGSYLLQSLNTQVFQDVEGLADNVRRVTRHLQATLLARGVRDAGRRALEVIPTLSGAPFHRTADGRCWRAYRFVADAVSPPVPATLHQVREASRCFGAFLRDMADLPAPPLAETIPHFHDTPRRYRDFEAALCADACGRAAAVRGLVEALRERESLASALDAPSGGSGFPRRVVHNDCKLDNVLLDVHTGEALCVVDLDTVMPGCMLYDFGDLVRSAACIAAEDGEDAPVFSPERYAAVLEGYLSGAGDLLSDPELSALAVAGRVVTYELALRFLTDHLRGDTYFAVAAPMQNRSRAARQLALLQAMEARSDEMDALARHAVAAYRRS